MQNESLHKYYNNEEHKSQSNDQAFLLNTAYVSYDLSCEM